MVPTYLPTIPYRVSRFSNNIQPFVFWNVTNVQVSNFAIDQPQLWSINIMNGTNMDFTNITVTVDGSSAPEGEDWAQNTDGFGIHPSLEYPV